MDKFWMVINTIMYRYICERYGDIPPRYRPSVIYWKREWAEEECLRLAKQNPDGQFAVLEATLHARQITNTAEFKLIESCDDSTEGNE